MAAEAVSIEIKGFSTTKDRAATRAIAGAPRTCMLRIALKADCDPVISIHEVLCGRSSWSSMDSVAAEVLLCAAKRIASRTIVDSSKLARLAFYERSSVDSLGSISHYGYEDAAFQAHSNQRRVVQ